DVDGVVVVGYRAPAAVIRQAIGRERALVSDDRCGDAAAAGRSHRQAREELGAAAIDRYVVEVDFGPARAIVTIVCAQELPAFVDLQRFPWIAHRRSGTQSLSWRVG